MADLTLLSRGNSYPFHIGIKEGARAEFLRTGGNTLQIIVPQMTAKEEKALRYGLIKSGLLYADGAMLWLFQFYGDKGPLITFDAPFDVRIIPAELRDLPNIDNQEQRLLIDVHIIDEKHLIRGLRQLTLPPDLTTHFLSRVQDQFACQNTGQRQLSEWMRYSPDQLISQTTTWTLGT